MPSEPVDGSFQPAQGMGDGPATMVSVWGDIFEVAVKRGILGWLTENRIGLPPEWKDWTGEWSSRKAAWVLDHAERQTGTPDPTMRAISRSYAEHLLHVGYGLGWTTIREWFARLRQGGRKHRILAMLCPLSLKDRLLDEEAVEPAADKAARAAEFGTLFGVHGRPDLARAGMPANADFLLLLEGRGERRLLCLEFSLNVAPNIRSYEDEAAHLEEVSRAIRLIRGRGVFSNVSPEVGDDGLALSRSMVRHVKAFTSQDKPLYKLAQGCSYASELVPLLPPGEPITVDVVAITAAGCESITASFSTPDGTRRRLVEALGRTYRHAPSVDGPEARLEHFEQVFRQIQRNLPRAMQEDVRGFLSAMPDRRLAEARFLIPVDGFVNPNDPVPGFGEGIEGEVDRFFSGDAVGAIERKLAETPGQPSLRDIHRAAISAALDSMPRGRMGVLALEGHPGIGKTTSALSCLHERAGDGCLFAYFSNRVVINGSVTRDAVVVEKDGKPPPVAMASITTNSILVGGASNWAAAHGVASRVDAAVQVRANGAAKLELPVHGSEPTLFLSEEEADSIADGRHSGRLRGKDLDRGHKHMNRVRSPGVLSTLAAATRELIRLNPDMRMLTVTAASQGYRETGRSNTVENLRGMFRHDRDASPVLALRERTEFAERFPLIVVMVDEIAGDGAGAPMCHALAEFLRAEFIDPFEGRSPFTVVLILADASLANPATFDAFIGSGASGGRAPRKIMVSRAERQMPFGLAASSLKLKGRAEPVLHVMANAYPARRLDMEIVLRLTALDKAAFSGPEERQVIEREQGERLVANAAREIMQARERDPGMQVLFFAQNRQFLRDVAEVLVDGGIDHAAVAVLDSSISPSDRRRLVEETVRDSKEVFLMTSAGSRGISFPKATTIAVMMPRFDIETSLMETGQAVFRGRGSYLDHVGEKADGDRLDRRLVFIVEDFAPARTDTDRDGIAWARRKIDIVTMMTLLWASVETRIKGAARLRDGAISVVPVGPVGVESAVHSLATSIREMMGQCGILTRQGRDRTLQALAIRVRKATESLFWDTGVTGKADKFETMMEQAPMLAFRRGATAAPRALLGPAGENPAVPADVFFLGSVIMERLEGRVQLQENIQLALWDPSLQKNRADLLACLIDIEAYGGCPRDLRISARDVLAMLSREHDLDDVDLTISGDLSNRGQWLTIPADYARFIAERRSENEARRTELNDPEGWMSCMLGAASLHASINSSHPLLPHYKGKPFALTACEGDPTGYDRVFDPRYLAATSEFNLLNALLFAGEDED